ncbi:hypothetical protein Clacol_004356 [Clathrus columnatus]|uniref:Arrestin-like N-terminal domain-containing protein n=1 Tax=Clathrus columnatus TaxID=1419009 RepID=A0AAV5AB36_9AGAM|nr:hypothetical protein Clacol_004356 [Clathrus columnatus]
MFTDFKQSRSKESTQNTFINAHSSSSQDRKLSIELPIPKRIYTSGSLVSGIVHLSNKDPKYIQEIQVSLICSVRSHYYQYLGSTTQDIRQETTKLFHRDQTLWTRNSLDGDIPPGDFHFEFSVPDSGVDSKVHDNNTSLPPSFHAGKGNKWNNGMPLGYVKYYVKVRVIRKGFFKLNETAIMPFIFLPPSGPPPLLPTLPERLSVQDLDKLKKLWEDHTVSSTIRHGIFNHQGEAILSLWLPRVDKLPRQTSIPFILSLILRAPPSKSHEKPSSLPTPPRLDKVTLYLEQKLQSTAQKGVHQNNKTYDKYPTDNLVHSFAPQESDWEFNAITTHWEKSVIWRGHWIFKETPNFTNRQFVLKVPMKGLGNDVKLTSRELDISSGLLAGQDPNFTILEPDFLPDYFDLDSHDEEDEKHEKEKN